MVWVLAAALAAGVYYEWYYFWVLPLIFSLIYISRRCHGLAPSGWWCVAALLVYGYGHLTTAVQMKRLASVQTAISDSDQAPSLQLTGWVSGFPRTGPRGARFRFTTRLAGGETDIIVYTRTPGLGYGDSLSFDGKVLKRRSRGGTDGGGHNYLLSINAAATVRVVPASLKILPGTAGSALNRWLFWPAHDALRRSITRLMGSGGGIPLALLLGEKDYLDKRIKRTFIDLGISHLLALSGMHLGLVAGAILLVFSRLGIRSWPALWLALTVYVGLVGEVVSLHRAYMMASLMLAARTMQRPIDPVMSLGGAVFMILLWSPWTIRSVGFQLSFTATLAVLLCVRRLSLPHQTNALKRIWSYSVSTVVIGIFVQLFLSPLLTLHFGRLSAVSPVATLIFFPFVLVVLLLSFVVSIAGAADPGTGRLLVPLLESSAELFRYCLLAADRLSPRLLKFPQMDVLLTAAGMYLIWQYGSGRWRVPAGLGLLALSLLKPLHYLHKLLMQ